MKLILCVFIFSVIASTIAEEEFADASARIAYKLYNDCSNDVGFSVCFKKKAITLLDRLGRMENVSLVTGINIVKKPDAGSNESIVTEKDLENTLPRALDAKEDALSYMLLDKLFKYVGSRSIEVALPKIDTQELVEEARKGDFGGGGGGGKKGKKGKKKGGMMGMMMMMMGTKMAALMGLKTIAAFFIAKKALIIGKIALLLSSMMLLNKFMKGKNGGGNSHQMMHSSGWDSSPPSSSGGSYGGGGGGWSSNSGGGWSSGGGGGGYDRRSYDPQDLAYRGYITTQK